MEDNKVKIYRFAALSLRRQIVEEKDSASLTWSMRGAYPRITVHTSNSKFYVDGKLDYNFIITAPFDIVTLMYFLQVLSMVNSDPKKGTEYAIDCLNTKVVDGVRTDEVYVQAEVRVGKGEDGVVWIAVTEDGKRKLRFSLLPNNQWFKYKNQDGNLITDKAFLSKIFTTSYIEAIKRLMLPKYSEYVTEVVIDKPNIVREVKNDNNTRAKETKSKVSIEDSNTGKEKKSENKEGNSSSSTSTGSNSATTTTTSGGNETGTSNGTSDSSKSTDRTDEVHGQVQNDRGLREEPIEGIDESMLQSLTKVPAEEPAQMDSDLAALLEM